MRAVDLAEFADDVRLRTNAGRLAHRAEVVARLTGHFATRPASVWLEALDRAGVPCGVVRSAREAVLERLREEEISVTEAARVGVPPLWNGRVRYGPPQLGEHSVTVREKGWDAFAHPE
jgi:crotonobetainyl-CoA:carnitine CoA-transferase CaiB-like acyl-CoA transferase